MAVVRGEKGERERDHEEGGGGEFLSAFARPSQDHGAHVQGVISRRREMRTERRRRQGAFLHNIACAKPVFCASKSYRTRTFQSGGGYGDDGGCDDGDDGCGIGRHDAIAAATAAPE